MHRAPYLRLSRQSSPVLRSVHDRRLHDLLVL